MTTRDDDKFRSDFGSEESTDEVFESLSKRGCVPKDYKGKKVPFYNTIDRIGCNQGEGIYFVETTGSHYCYYDGEGNYDHWFNPYGEEPAWKSERENNKEE